MSPEDQVMECATFLVKYKARIIRHQPSELLKNVFVQVVLQYNQKRPAMIVFYSTTLN